MANIIANYLLDNGYKLDPNGTYWIDLQTHYLELLFVAGEWYPTIAQLPEISSEREQRVSVAAIKTIDQLTGLIKIIKP